MPVNKGKDFEKYFSLSCDLQDISYIRLYDTMTGYKNVSNPCDFIISKDKHKPSILIECKSTHDNTWHLNYRQSELLKKLTNFISMVCVWFVERKEMWLLNTETIEKLKIEGHKSFKPELFKDVHIPGILELNVDWNRVNPKFINIANLFYEV